MQQEQNQNLNQSHGNVEQDELLESRAKQYKITYNLDGGINSNSNVSLLYEGEDLSLSAPEKYAYSFKGWYTDNNFNNKIEVAFNISKDIDLFAKWEINEDYYDGFPIVHINTQNVSLLYGKETYINASFKIDNCEEDVVFNYIVEYITSTFTTLKTNGPVEFQGQLLTFEDLVDVDSFLEYWLVNEIMHNQDARKKSIYMHKTKYGKLHFGPTWDFDWSLSSDWSFKPYIHSEIHTATELCILAYDTPLRDFVVDEENFQLLVDKWNEVKHEILELTEHLRTYKYDLSKVAKYDAIYWYGETTGAILFDAQYDYVRLYLLDRYNFLDSYFNNIE